MANVKTITATTTESTVEFSATYQFMWFRNLGENDCYICAHSGIVASADDVTLLKAGEVARLTLPQAPAQSTAYIKAADGSNSVEVHAQNYSDCPFKTGSKGGGSGSSANIYRTTTALTDGATTNPITVDSESVTVVSGDFAVYNTQEFLFDGTQWNLLGDRVGLGDLAYKSSATGTALTTAGTLPSLIYDSANERLMFNAGTLPTSGTVTVS